MNMFDQLNYKGGQATGVGMNGFRLMREMNMPSIGGVHLWVLNVTAIAEVSEDTALRPEELPNNIIMGRAAALVADAVSAKPEALEDHLYIEAAGYIWNVRKEGYSINTGTMPGECGYHMGITINCLRTA